MVRILRKITGKLPSLPEKNIYWYIVKSGMAAEQLLNIMTLNFLRFQILGTYFSITLEDLDHLQTSRNVDK